jgi:hypothetical protein
VLWAYLRCWYDLIGVLLRATGVPVGLLFDWALPVLSGEAPVSVSTQTWCLVAVKECLALVDPIVLGRYSNAVLLLCQQLLETDSTSEHLVAPILGVVMEVGLLACQQFACLLLCPCMYYVTSPCMDS